MTYEDTEEQPLDPVMERVRRKMMRLMIISVGIMMIGLFSVLFAIIYKIGNVSESENQNADQVVETEVRLSPGAELVSTKLDSGRLVLESRDEENRHLFITIDTVSGKVISRITVVETED